MYEKNTYRLYPIMNRNVRSMHGAAIISEFGLSFTILEDCGGFCSHRYSLTLALLFVIKTEDCGWF